MIKIAQSIPVKISLAILIIEVILLTVMGVFYSSRFSQEIDSRIAEKLALPGILMNQRAMTYDSVEDFESLSDLVQEKVIDAFIFKRGGEIFFTADSTKEGKSYTNFLTSKEQIAFTKDPKSQQQIEFEDDNGNHFISNLAPLHSNGEILGGLYVRISSNAVDEKKLSVIKLFCFGSLLTIILTTIIEVLIVHRLIVPRINDTSTILHQYAGGDFSARITSIGSPDQLGELMRLVNFLLDTIATYTRKLHALNVVGDTFGRINTKEEILHIATETLEQQVQVRALESTEEDAKSIISLPVHAVDGLPVVKFGSISGYKELTSAEASFVFALSGLIDSALHRIEAFTEITKAEEKYRDLFHSALEGIFRSSVDGKILECNPALAAMAGYSSEEEMISSILNLYECYENPLKREKMLDILIKEGKVQDLEVNLLRRDGSSFPAAISVRAIKNELGEILNLEGRVVDISERKMHEQKRQEQLAAEAVAQSRLLLVRDLEKKNRQLQVTLDELKMTQRQLVQSEKMAAVGMTAGGVAHDLNNILSGVVGYPELLLTELPPDSEIRPSLEAILASGKRAVAVVADLLTLAQGSERTKQRVTLDKLVEEYLDSAEFKEMMRVCPNVEVRANCKTEKMSINCSPVQIQKVVMNLVMNAVEAVSPGGGSVTLRTKSLPKNRKNMANQEDFVLFEVSDNGPGIPPENRDKIFEPFYTRKVLGKKGTGLGLTVVWNVVQEHEGKIELDSDSNQTTFRVFLPGEEHIHIQSSVPEVNKKTLQGQGRILVVDDEPLQRDIAEKILTTHGYEVATVSSGEEAISYLSDQSVDLVMLDMLMPPGMNGLQTYREIILLYPGQKALIVSGFSKSSDVKKAIDLGVGSFVKKPYTMVEIGQAIKEELQRGSSESVKN